MAILPDLGAAGLSAVAAFLLVLGVLVVFVETIQPSRLVLIMIACFAVAVGLVILSESGLALVVLGVGAAFLANHVFESLTTR